MELRASRREAVPQEDDFMLDPSIVDRERPVEADRLAAEFVPRRSRPVAARRLMTAVVLLLSVAALAAAWRWTPLREMLDLRALASDIRILMHAPFTPLLVLGAYVLASLVAFPIMLLIVATALVFDPMATVLYAWTGSLLGAAAGFALGRVMARDLVQRVSGARLSALGRRLGRQGILAVVALRLIPIAPFTVINLVAGASRVRFRDFMLGTFLGLSPGIIAVTLFGDRLATAVREPSAWSLTVLGVLAAGIVAGAIALQRWLTRRAVSDMRAPTSSSSGAG
jgi:uncharacterized membrane protein YdjX (TVP38/TMEM64 family)